MNLRTINVDMDPKTTSNLDPKLKDMYNRVMSTPVPPPAAPTTPPQPEMPALAAPEPQTPQPSPTTEIHAAMPLPAAPKPVSAAIIGGGTKSKNTKLLPVLLAIVGIIFLGVYTVFWVKFFNLSVPFLPF